MAGVFGPCRCAADRLAGMNGAAPVLLHRGLSRLRLLVRRLHLIRDVEHAHSPGSDIGVPGRRRRSWHGLRLDVLGDRTGDVEAASQRRSGRVADPGSCAANIAQFLVTGFAVHHSQFSDKLHLFFDTSLDRNLRRCGLCTQACMSGKEFVGMESFAVPP